MVATRRRRLNPLPLSGMSASNVQMSNNVCPGCLKAYGEGGRKLHQQQCQKYQQVMEFQLFINKRKNNTPKEEEKNNTPKEEEKSDSSTEEEKSDSSTEEEESPLPKKRKRNQPIRFVPGMLDKQPPKKDKKDKQPPKKDKQPSKKKDKKPPKKDTKKDAKKASKPSKKDKKNKRKDPPVPSNKKRRRNPPIRYGFDNSVTEPVDVEVVVINSSDSDEYSSKVDSDDDDNANKVDKKSADKANKVGSDTDDDDIDQWVFGRNALKPPDKLIRNFCERRAGFRRSIFAFTKGVREREKEFKQFHADILFHRWQTYYEMEARTAMNQTELDDIRLKQLHLVTLYRSRCKHVARDRKKLLIDASKDRRGVATAPATLNHLKDRAVCNSLLPALVHVHNLQRLTTFHTADEYNANSKSEHVLMSIDELVPAPQHPKKKANQSEGGHESKNKKLRKEPLTLMYLPEHICPQAFGTRLKTIAQEMENGTNHRVRFTRTPQAYYRLLVGKTNPRLSEDCLPGYDADTESDDKDKNNGSKTAGDDNNNGSKTAGDTKDDNIDSETASDTKDDNINSETASDTKDDNIDSETDGKSLENDKKNSSYDGYESSRSDAMNSIDDLDDDSIVASPIASSSSDESEIIEAKVIETESEKSESETEVKKNEVKKTGVGKNEGEESAARSLLMMANT